MQQLGETTSKNAALLSVQMDKFVQDHKTLADQRIADMTPLYQRVTDAANDRDRQVAIMKLANEGNEIDFLNSITAIAQNYADRQYPLNQAANFRNTIEGRLTTVNTPTTALRGVSKDLDSLSKTSMQQQILDLLQFSAEVSDAANQLQAAQSNATKNATTPATAH